jgi:UDP-N-acetyl-D-mannosaminuronic acid transferase (WecB/TagA/CpsF family)
MLRDLVKAFFIGRHDVEFVGEVERAGELLPALAETEANVVLVGVREEALSPGEARLLGEPPHVRVLTIRDDGRAGDLYHVDAVRVPIEELSADALLGAVGAETAQ